LISASKHANNKLPIDVANYDRGVDEYYFANGFLVEQSSRDLLIFSKLRQEAFNTTAMSSCCGTLMCGTHPVYEGASVSVNADSCRVETSFVMPTQVILFGCDFPEDKYAELQTRAQAPLLFSVYDEIDSEPMTGFLKAVTEPLAKVYQHADYVTFEGLSEQVEIQIDNAYFDESRTGKI
jgi:hypothetical protein|tara:strand:+ start:1647 stop:2186 length:540 start_codon:yes stop_codon:yes gene_type:complete